MNPPRRYACRFPPSGVQWRARQGRISTLVLGSRRVQDVSAVHSSVDIHTGPGLGTAAAETAPPAPRVPLLLIIGPPGVGKSSAAREVSRMLEEAWIAFAYVDRDDFGVDGLLHEDPLVDLQQILRSGVAGGAQRLVVAWRIESDDELGRFRNALPWADITRRSGRCRPAPASSAGEFFGPNAKKSPIDGGRTPTPA